MKKSKKNLLKLTLQKQKRQVHGFIKIDYIHLGKIQNDNLENQQYFINYQKQKIQLNEDDQNEDEQKEFQKLICKDKNSIEVKFDIQEWIDIQNYILDDAEQTQKGIKVQFEHTYQIQNKKGQMNQQNETYEFFIDYTFFLQNNIKMQGTQVLNEKENISNQAELVCQVQFDQQIFIERDKQKTYGDNVTKISKNMQIKDVLKQLVGIIKNTCIQICKLYQKQTNSVSGSYDEFKKFNAFTEQQKIKLLNQRKFTFFKDFLKQQQSQIYKQSFYNVVQKLYFDIIDKNFLDPSKNCEIVYSELQVILSKITNQIIAQFFEQQDEQIPLALKYFEQHCQQQDFRIQEYQNCPEEYLDQRIREFEKVGFFYEAEQLLIFKIQNNDQNSQQYWFQLSQFYIRRQNYELAEAGLQMAIKQQQEKVEYRQIQACLYYRRKKFIYFEKLICENLQKNKWSIIDNLLMSHYYTKIHNRAKLSKKYYNVAYKRYCHGKYQQKRSLNNFETNSEENLWKELIMFLFQNCLEFILEEIVEERIKQQQSFKNLILGNIYSIRQKMQKSNTFLNKVIDETEANTQYQQEALLTKACNLYFTNHHYDAELVFLEYLQKADKNKIYDVLLMMGFSYCQRKAFKEAHLIFCKLKEYNSKSLLIWIGLSLTSLNLNLIQQAEEAISAACSLDPIYSTVWGYIILINFQKIKNFNLDMEYIKKLYTIYKNLEIQDLSLAMKISQRLLDIKEIDIGNQLKNYSIYNLSRFCMLKQNQEINWLIENKKVQNAQII